ncbi:ABC transporter substrate-binding protein [Kutzneria kofuensis]|uniref:Multiple sugar transport system substrate-binding protein n=1 Tax=Kutzneria kofuensis TaxID=103725 RepID=A0A7W9KQJ1_9PSEU|nr:sugar ABC transporter substrate-binding protein [Kutzneria kofuensis]MBB5896879.1 multiple sugar transport system substrate-binding protein [Kutzneria kofuensis]
MSRIRATALALVCGLALAGCGDDGGGGAETITFWDNNGGPARTPVFQHLIGEFERANPGIHVEYVGIPSSSVQQKYDTAIAGGATPDVGGITTSYLSDLVGQDALEPLDDRLAASPLHDKLLPNLVDDIRKASGDHKLYELPSSANLDVIWYRKDWFAQAGLQPPSTWDELIADATKLTDKAANRYGYTVRGGAGSVFQLLSEAYAYSGVPTFFTDNGVSTTADPGNVDLVRKIAALYGKATPTADVNNGYTQMVAEFTGGSVAMMHHNLGSSGDVLKALGPDKVGAIPLPVGPSGKRTVVPNPTDGFGVFKASEHQDAAWKFVQFLLSKESNSYWNQRVGQIPANTDVYGDAWLRADAPVEMALGVLRAKDTVLASAPFALPQFSAITKADSEPLYQKVLLGTMSADDFLRKLADELTAAERDWRSHNG